MWTSFSFLLRVSIACVFSGNFSLVMFSLFCRFLLFRFRVRLLLVCLFTELLVTFLVGVYKSQIWRIVCFSSSGNSDNEEHAFRNSSQSMLLRCSLILLKSAFCRFSALKVCSWKLCFCGCALLVTGYWVVILIILWSDSFVSVLFTWRTRFSEFDITRSSIFLCLVGTLHKHWWW